MREILAPAELAEKLCAAQEPLPGREYRAARHSLRIPCDEGTLLFHTLTGELVLLEHGETDAVRAELVRRRFLVPADLDENRYADEIRRVAALLAPAKKRLDSFTVLTTTDCNARCYYCYERGRSRIPMSEQTALDAAAFIATSCRGEAVKLSWFGGEPLYNIPAIDTITGALRDHGVDFTSTMVSNGYFLTRDVALRARRDWLLERVQITVDGTEAVYNRVKAYIDPCENPFQRVMDNIGAALDAKIRVILRLNVDRSNAADMETAVEQLGKRFGGRDNCKITVALLRPFAGSVCEFATEQDAVDCYYSLIEKAECYGIALDKPLFRGFAANHCMADSDACAVILPDGRLGKCEHFSETELYGSIYSPETDRELLCAWRERATAADMPECADCPLYPRCINLKKCDWTKKGCPGSVRMIREENLRRQLLKEYQKWRGVT